LSTGLRINSGKDDPAGLIASESLRSDITSINKALTNTQRANQIIGTADSALGQVSSLLNDIRGLVTEAANKGGLSDDEIAANQLQVDSSLEAINRISQTTTFQGRRLLDGSLDFVTKAGTGFTTVSDLRIDQANLGATGSLSVDVSVSAAATKATITSSGVPASTTAVASAAKLKFGTPEANGEATIRVALAAANTIGAEASGTVSLNASFSIGAEATTGTAFALGSGVKLNITALNNGVADGLVGNSTIIEVRTNGTATTAAYDATTKVLTIDLLAGATEAVTVGALNTALTSLGFGAVAGGGAGVITNSDVGVFTGKFTGGTNPVLASSFKLNALNGGSADGLKGNSTTIDFTSGATTSAAYNATTNKVTVTVAAGATLSQITTKLNTDLAGNFIATDVTNGAAIFSSTNNGSNAATLTSGTDPVAAAQFDLTATNGGLADGTKANTTKLVFSSGVTSAATYDAASNELRVVVATGATVNSILTAINTQGTFQVSGTTLNGTSLFNATDLGPKTPTVVTAGTDNSKLDTITISAKNKSADFNKSITFVTDNSFATGIAQAKVDSSTGNITITTKDTGNVTIGTIRDAINTLTDYSATLASEAGADGIYSVGVDAAPAITDLADVTRTTLTGGTQGGGLNAELIFQLTGGSGAEVFKFQKGASLASIIQSVNLLKDATGVEATNDGGNLKFTSSSYGSKSLAAVDVVSEGLGGTFKTGLSSARSSGTDIAATVNGISATGDGNSLSINSSTLSFALTVADGSSAAVRFDITGGGALFQLGGDVVSNQQARLGISSLNTAKLGGVSGKLFELASGASKSLTNDVTAASKVVDEVIGKVTTLRGRLGAFQRTALESNSVSLNDTLANLNEAQSAIRDADFAKESANLTRAQILVQSGTSVLGIANQSSQSVLSLLR